MLLCFQRAANKVPQVTACSTLSIFVTGLSCWTALLSDGSDSRYPAFSGPCQNGNEASDRQIKRRFRTVCGHKSPTPTVSRIKSLNPPAYSDEWLFHKLTFSQHAHLLALPQPTLLAFPAHVHVHFTGPTTLAFVHSVFCNAPPKET